MTPPPGAVSVGTAGFTAMPFKFSFDGNFHNLSTFFSRLERFVTVSNDQVNVTGRLLRLESLTLKPDDAGNTLTARDRRQLVPGAADAERDRRRHRRHPGLHDAGRRRAPRLRRPPRPPLEPSDERSQGHLGPAGAAPAVAGGAAARRCARRRPVRARQGPRADSGRSGARGTKAQQAAVAADADPIVALASADEARRRRVLGASKDPFEPAPVKAVKPAAPLTPSRSTPRSPRTRAPAPALGGGSTPSFDVPVEPEPETVPEAPKPVYPLYSLTVRFGLSESLTLPKSKVQRLQALPDSDAPVLVYLGVLKGGKAAVFMVDHGTAPRATAPASRRPTPARRSTCAWATPSSSTSSTRTASHGPVPARPRRHQDQAHLLGGRGPQGLRQGDQGRRKVLRARQASRPLRYRYDARRGVVKRLGKPAFKAAMARARLRSSAPAQHTLLEGGGGLRPAAPS